MLKLLLIIGDVATDEFPLDKPQINIGRNSDNDIVLDDPLVSTRHAIVTLTVSAYKQTTSMTLQDLNSTNGTRLNGKNVRQATLRHNDQLQVGRSIFRVVDNAPILPDATHN